MMNRIFIILYTIDLAFCASSCAPALEPQDQDGQWSPNDNKIVYVCFKKERVKRDGIIIFSRIGPYDREGAVLSEICITDAEGTYRNQITNDQSIDYDPAWSPNGEKIIFASQQAQSDEKSLFIVNQDGTDLRRLIILQNSGANNFRWSPDGDRIAFIDKFYTGDLYTIRPNGTDLKRLTKMGGITYYDWAPNGDEIVFDNSYLGNDGNFYSGIFIIEVATGRRNQLTTDLIYADQPIWSPAGDYIAYRSGREIYLINTINDEVTQLTNTGGLVFDLIWHPSDPIIAYTASEFTFDIDLYIQDINSQNIRMIKLGDILPFSILWSSDGRYILYEKAEDLNEDSFYEFKLWAVNIETGEQWSISNNVDKFVSHITP